MFHLHLRRVLLGIAIIGACATQPVLAQPVYWLNHLDLLPGDETVMTDFQSVSCPGGTLNGLAITSSTTGESGPVDQNKVVAMGVEVPPDFKINGVRVCYENSSENSFISQIRLCQLLSPPDQCLVRLDDGTDLTDPGPVCVTSAAPSDGPIETGADIEGVEGPVRLSLRVNFGDTGDNICLRAVGLVGTSVEQGAAACGDGIDNDGDGDTDCDDSDCADKPFCGADPGADPGPEEFDLPVEKGAFACKDGIDNDGDGDTDCDDLTCAGKPFCGASGR